MEVKTDIISYESGQIKRIGRYRNDKKHGQWVFFFENDIVKWIGNYDDGSEFGIWKEWYESGQLKEECKYLNGEKYALNFWDKEGNQILIDGTGYTVEEYGSSDADVYKHYYKDGVFEKEEKISGVTFGKFNPLD
jgi:antitoxin component YwqK of YwqJK toxin-antitoxin module